MPINICACGAEPGYLHEAECPFPLYRGNIEDQNRWYKLRNELRNRINKSIYPPPRRINLGKEEKF